MLKRTIYPEDVVVLLNEMLVNDPIAMNKLIESRVPCNKRTAEHPLLQINFDDPDRPKLGIVGFLNGLFGKVEGKGCIIARYNSEGALRDFFVKRPEISSNVAYYWNA